MSIRSQLVLIGAVLALLVLALAVIRTRPNTHHPPSNALEQAF